MSSVRVPLSTSVVRATAKRKKGIRMNTTNLPRNQVRNHFRFQKKELPAVKVALGLAVVLLAGALTGTQGQVTQLAGTVVAWGGGATNVPAGLTNVVAVAGGQPHALALRSDGTVVAWGNQTNVPVGLSWVIAIAAGVGMPEGGHSLALKSNGTVVAWGGNEFGAADVPGGLSGVAAISAGHHSLALKSNGTVVAWGSNLFGETNVPVGLSNVTAIAAGNWFSLALTADGTVVSWGQDIPFFPTVPPDLSNVVAIAAGGWARLALKADGTVVGWGLDQDPGATVPPGLSGVIAIAGGGKQSLALKSDGTVVAWGDNRSGEANVPVGLGGVIAIAGGDGFSLVVVAEPELRTGPASQTAEAGSTVEFRVSATGAPALAYHWFCNGVERPDCTNCVLELADVQSSNAGEYSVVITNLWGSGSVTSAPANLNVIPPVLRRMVPGLSLLGQPGSVLNLDCATGVGTASEWATLDSIVLTQTSQWYFDHSTPLPPQKFYRVWQTTIPATPPLLSLNMVPALTLAGNPGDKIRVDGINQFGPTDAWFTLDTVTLTNTTQLYFDVTAPGPPEWFYRLIQLP